MQKKNDKKKVVSAKFIRDNVCLGDVQELKKVSLEHKSANYHYSKKKFENKSYNINFIILEKHICRKHFFLRGKSISRNFFFFEKHVTLV